MARAPAAFETEPLPEADRLEPFPHPRATAELFGHLDVEHAFAGMIAAGRMHHAWLLAGPEGIGKATLAYRLARYLLASPSERVTTAMRLDITETSIAARQVLALSHPGLLVIRRPYDAKAKRFAASIPVDEVRRVRDFLTHTAGPDAWRVVIVDSADDLNANAANALLKSLEEPPSRTVFLIVTSEPGRLLPTIRSRCRTLALAPLDASDLRRASTAALEAAGLPVPAGAEWPRLERLAQGSVRRLVRLASTGGLKVYEQTHALVRDLPQIDWAMGHALADEVGAHAAETKLEAFFDHLLGLVARLVRAAATGSGDADEVALARRLIRPDTLASWAELWETIAREKATTLALNLDRKALVLDTLVRLETRARS